MTVIGELLSQDSFTIWRNLPGVDDEGIPKSASWRQIGLGAYRGTWGSASSTDLDLLGRHDEQIEAVCAGMFPARANDQLRGLRGKDWKVLHVRDTRIHRRAFLRQV